MAHRIEVSSTIADTRAAVRKKKIEKSGYLGKISSVELVDVYTIDAALDAGQLASVASMLVNPITQKAAIDSPQSPKSFDWAIEIGYLPGVKDNVAATTKEGIEDYLKSKLPEGEDVYTSQVTFILGTLSRDEVVGLGNSLANSLIQRIHIKSAKEFAENKGMGVVVPKVRLSEKPKADTVEILNANDELLGKIGKEGVANPDGTRRGPLALDLAYMKAIQDYFKQQGRNPTDIELESIAQTWSEHCKHTIFADPIDEIKDGLYSSAKRLEKILSKLVVDKESMQKNFNSASGKIIAEPLYILFAHYGHPDAHEFVKQLTLRAEKEKKPLREVIENDAEGSKWLAKLDERQREMALDAHKYIGIAEQKTEQICANWKKELKL